MAKRGLMFDYSDLIGIPFEYGGRGPDTLDCYGLVMLMHQRNGISIPDYRSPEALSDIANAMAGGKYRWSCHAEKPDEGHIPMSAMIPGRVLEIRIKGLACHVGYICRPYRFLHTWEATGGVVEESIELWRSRILGVYEYNGQNHADL